VSQPSTFVCLGEGDSNWYDLFSRGARDWLRHNEIIGKAVREKLPELLSQADILGGGEDTVKVPVRFMEHFRFRLRAADELTGAGQGGAKPGDKLGKVGDQQQQGEGEKGAGGNGEGGFELMLEFRIDDLIEWLWEELKLPNLKTKTGDSCDDDYVREGWNRRGARSRLDRRRSMKEAIKRRAVDVDGPAFINDDLRYRQLVVRKQPATKAVVFFAMDVSSSMRDRDRKLAKTFFFWVMQGLRRQYQQIEIVYVAHTVKAWEFDEAEFFQVRGSGGTVASTAFDTIVSIIDSRYDPSQYNVYLFYASDGENFRDDHDRATDSLAKITSVANCLGYIETPASADRALETETAGIFKAAQETGAPASSFALINNESVWEAIRGFFQQHAATKTR